MRKKSLLADYSILLVADRFVGNFSFAIGVFSLFLNEPYEHISNLFVTLDTFDFVFSFNKQRPFNPCTGHNGIEHFNPFDLFLTSSLWLTCKSK